MRVFVLNLLKLLLANFLVGHCEVFIKALLFYCKINQLRTGLLTRDKMSRNRIRVMDLCGIDKLMIASSPFLKSCDFDSFFVAHCCSFGSGARHNVVEL